MNVAVLGIDIGTSSVKVIAVNKQGDVLKTVTEPLNIIKKKTGYNEQNPIDWFENVKLCIKNLMATPEMQKIKVQGLSFSGQMHSLVILDESYNPIRDAILWNDTRTSSQCEEIKEKSGDYVLSNPVLDGFTLPKLLWIKENEPENWKKIKVFLLPKDYVRYRMTGHINMEYSDASSTLLLDPKSKVWSTDLGKMYGLDDIYPPLVSSTSFVGYVSPDIAGYLGLDIDVKVFAGGGDNACGALGSGIIKPGNTLCSIGTSGTVLTYEEDKSKIYSNNMHYFNHVIENSSYIMGVTLSAGDSLSWARKSIFPELSFSDIIDCAEKSQIGGNRLLFAPYLSGERTPYGDANIRGSFIGLSSLHSQNDLARAIVEGITYSLYTSIVYLRSEGHSISNVISIGGGAKSDFWLQLQSDIYNSSVSKLQYEEGPSMGAAMLAVYGVGWYKSIDEVVNQFIKYEKTFSPNIDKHKEYKKMYEIFKDIYFHTSPLTKRLLEI